MQNRIKKILNENGIDLNQVVIGKGKTYCKSNSRFVFQAGNRKEILNKSAKIAIKYYEEQDIIILWNVYGITNNHTVRRGTFSVSRESVFRHLEDKIAKKYVVYEGREKENVLIFSTQEIESLINYVKEMLK